MKIPKIHTVLFTNICPLRCNYCNLRAQESWGKFPEYSKEEFFKEIESNLDADGFLFTGGEPFVRWEWIKEVLEKYGKKYRYEFNTCGYYFTDEILEFLSHYNVRLNLSVDGPREIAMWRRPNSNGFQYDYWDKIEPMFPAILYYFPNTIWKSIISKRLIPFLPKIYCAAANYGFRYIHFELDFEEQPWRAGRGEAWTEEDYKKYELAVEYITAIMVDMLKDGRRPVIEMRMDDYIRFLMNQNNRGPFTINSVNCGIAARRDITSLYNREKAICLDSVCGKEKCSLDSLFKKIEEDYKKGCPINKDCQFFDFCARFSCLKDNYDCNENCLAPNPEFCNHARIWGTATLKFLTIGNEFFEDSPVYQNLLLKYKGGRMR